MKIPTKRGYTLAQLLVTVAIIGVLAGLLFPVSRPSGENAPRSSCQSNLKQLGLAMMQYAQDNGERFPPLAIHAVASSTDSFSKQPYGWADAIQIYARSTQLLQCSSEKVTVPSEDATQSGYTDYWFNTNLNALSFDKMSSPQEIFLLGEGNDGLDGSDARYNRNVLPQRWIDDENSPSRRHLETANYLYADGHVKASKPQTVVASNGFTVQRD